MTERVFVSRSENDTRELGRRLGERLESGLCVLLYGDLGAGKTVLVRGVGEALGISGIRSPSFTLINEYDSDSGLVIHADLYRLDDASSLGLEDYGPLPDSRSLPLPASPSQGRSQSPMTRGDTGGSQGRSDPVLFVEWPDRWRNPPVNNVLKVYISALSESEREIKITADGEKAERVLMTL